MPSHIFEERAYQTQAIHDLRASGKDPVILHAPTGSGKTAVMCNITSKSVAKGKTVMFLCDSSEIVEQTSATMEWWGVGHGIIQGSQIRRQRPWESVHIATVQTLRNRQLTRKDLVFVDECLSGDALVETDHGPMRIDDPRIARRHALSFNEESGAWEYKKILRWIPRSKQQTINIQTNHSSLTCTANHPVMTLYGWKPAGHLRANDRIVAFRNSPELAGSGQSLHHACVDAGRPSLRQRSWRSKEQPPAINTGACIHTLMGIEPENHTPPSRGLNWLNLRAPFAGAVVERASKSPSELRIATTPIWEFLHTGPGYDLSSGMGTRSSIKRQQLENANRSAKRCSDWSPGHFSATPTSAIRTVALTIQGWLQLTGPSSDYGLNIKHSGWRDYGAESIWLRIGDSENNRPDSLVLAIQISDASTTLCGRIAERKPSHSHGLISSPKRASRGGTWTTDHALSRPGARTYYFTRRGIHKKSAGSLPCGSLERDLPANREPTTERNDHASTRSSACVPTQPESLSRPCGNTKPLEWSTSFQTVLTIRPDIEREVFDLEVEGNHNFLANGVLVHNCHLFRAKSYEKVLEFYLASGAKLIGASASPCRLDGRGLGKFFKRIIYCPSIQALTAQGYLVPFRIWAPPAPSTEGVHTVAGDFNKGEIARLMDKPKIVGDVVEHYGKMARDRLAILAAPSIEMSKHLMESFRGAGIAAEHADGTSSPDERRRALTMPAPGVICQCDIAGKGWDRPEVSCAIDCRPTQSLARWLQFVGRSIRLFPGKIDSLLLDHSGNVHRFGFPDEDREWSLEEKPQKPKEVAAPITTCRQCFGCFRPGPRACPYCGAEIEHQAREIRVEEGKLEELKRGETAREQHRSMVADSVKLLQLKDLMKTARLRGYHGTWVTVKCLRLWGHAPSKEWIERVEWSLRGVEREQPDLPMEALEV